jgi:hypothetical protein
MNPSLNALTSRSKVWLRAGRAVFLGFSNAVAGMLAGVPRSSI